MDINYINLSNVHVRNSILWFVCQCEIFFVLFKVKSLNKEGKLLYTKSFIINCIFSESLSTHNATIKRSSAESDIKWTLCGKKKKKLLLEQDAIKTTNTTEKEEVEAGKRE